jgi:hypothetical protein
MRETGGFVLCLSERYIFLLGPTNARATCSMVTHHTCRLSLEDLRAIMAPQHAYKWLNTNHVESSLEMV